MAAVKVGAVTELAARVERVIELSDIVVLALQPSEALEALEMLAPIMVDRPGYCTDVAAVKVPVVARATELELDRHFAGSHPFVELRSTGFDGARPDLLSGQIVYVTPLAGGDVATAEVADFWARVVGAEPVIIDAETHDSTLAWTSHVPKVLASTLAAALAKRGPKGVTYGEGALEATRTAVANTEGWAETILMNRSFILAALDSLLADAGRLMIDIEAQDVKRIRDWLESASEWRRRMEG